MELWIRSQDKEKLVKCNDIAIATDIVADTEYGRNVRGYKIVGYFDKQTEYEELGFYTLLSRALEILEDIDSFKDALQMLELTTFKDKMIIEFMKKKGTFTYLMPKK